MISPKPIFLRLLPWLLLVSLIATGAAEARASAAAPMATIMVTTNSDELNSDGDCSLREALRAANTNTAVDACPAGSGTDVISIPAGTYVLTLAGSNEDAGLTGDLDINSSLRIAGAGPGETVLDGNASDRVFHITGPYAVKIASMTIRNGFISGAYGGAGIFNGGGNLQVSNVVFSENHSFYTGGGLDNIGTASLQDVTFANNTATFGGGAYNGLGMDIVGAVFYGNTSTTTGGGLDNGGDATLTNVTFSDNVSPEGGGVFSDGSVRFFNATLAYNNVAIFLGGGEARLKNTIIAYSTSGVNCDKRVGSPATFTTLGNNLEDIDTCSLLGGIDLIGVNPLLGPLQDNDGPTLTHALLNGSPAIDSGDTPYCPPLDQRNRLRPADGDGDEFKACDIGAFELNGVSPLFMYLPTALKK